MPHLSIPCTGTKRDLLELSLISLSSVLPDEELRRVGCSLKRASLFLL